MKRTLSVLLIALTLTIPVNAQETPRAINGFDLRRAIAREAERFAEDNSSRSDGQSQSVSSHSSNWSRVQALARREPSYFAIGQPEEFVDGNVRSGRP
jgi:hypothetical protein